jgi:hypothetical protein
VWFPQVVVAVAVVSPRVVLQVVVVVALVAEVVVVAALVVAIVVAVAVDSVVEVVAAVALPVGVAVLVVVVVVLEVACVVAPKLLWNHTGVCDPCRCKVSLSRFMQRFVMTAAGTRGFSLCVAKKILWLPETWYQARLCTARSSSKLT